MTVEKAMDLELDTLSSSSGTISYYVSQIKRLTLLELIGQNKKPFLIFGHC